MSRMLFLRCFPATGLERFDEAAPLSERERG